jgi:hypothetical protein
MTDNYKVFVKTNGLGCIVAINSSAFLSSFDGWTLIDEGIGDRYHHAQGNYLPKPIMDDYGVYRYKLMDGVAVERTLSEMDADRPGEKEEQPTLERRVETLETSNAELAEAVDMILSGVTE